MSHTSNKTFTFIGCLVLLVVFHLFISDIVHLTYETGRQRSVQDINLKMIDKIQTMNLQGNLKSRMMENLNTLIEQLGIDGLQVALKQDQKVWKAGTVSKVLGQGSKTFFDSNRGTLDFSWEIYATQAVISASNVTKLLQVASFVLFGLYCWRLNKMLRYGEPQNIDALNRFFGDAKVELPACFEPLNQFRSELTRLRRTNEELVKRCQSEEQHCYYFRAEYLPTDRMIGRLIHRVKELINSGEDYQVMVNMFSDLYLLLLQSWTNECVLRVFEQNNLLKWNYQTFNVKELMFECHAVLGNYARQQKLSLILDQELLKQEEIVGDAKIMHHLFITWIFSLIELATEKSEIHWGLQIQQEFANLFLSLSHPKHFYTLEELTHLAQSFESGKELCKKFGQEPFKRSEFFLAASTFFMQLMRLQNCKVFRQSNTLYVQIPFPIQSLH